MSDDKKIEYPYQGNTSYLFLPFLLEDSSKFPDLKNSLKNSRYWDLEHDKIRYMYKYVADKIGKSSDDSSEDDAEDNYQCYHFSLNSSACETFHLITSQHKDHWYRIQKPSTQAPNPIRFQIEDVQLYIFSTSVGILAYHIHFASDDPYEISSTQYDLKKAARTTLIPDKFSKPDPNILEKFGFTFLGKAKNLLKEVEDEITPLHFFYYTYEGEERANFLTFLEVEKKSDYKNELYFLRRCYSDGYSYFEDKALEEREIYQASGEVFWGITPEATVCLVSPEEKNRTFYENVFYKNFNKQYLFMYVYLLHQKYALYKFLTNREKGNRNDFDYLQKYRKELYEYEADFDYACITEVPQYQTLYERIRNAFMLQKMYQDVNEPLTALAEERERREEERRREQESVERDSEKNLNTALLFLSLLGIFSALIDSYDFLKSLLENTFVGHLLSETSIFVSQCVCAVFIFVIAGWIVREFFVFRRKNRKK